MRNLPEIRFQYGIAINEAFKRLVELDPKISNKSYPTEGDVLQKIKDFEIVWRPLEKTILNSICDLLGLNFQQNIIYVTFIGRGRSMSRPFIVSSHYQPDFLIGVLTHELIHVLSSDNKENINYPPFKEQYIEEARDTKDHILVHAILTYIYLDVLKDETKLKDDIERTKRPEYIRAWQIVKDSGYKEIIDNFKRLSIKRSASRSPR